MCGWLWRFPITARGKVASQVDAKVFLRGFSQDPEVSSDQRRSRREVHNTAKGVEFFHAEQDWYPWGVQGKQFETPTVSLHPCEVDCSGPTAVTKTKPRPTLFVNGDARVRASCYDCRDKPHDGRFTARAGCRAAVHQGLRVTDRVSIHHVGVQLLKTEGEVLDLAPALVPSRRVLQVSTVRVLA